MLLGQASRLTKVFLAYTTTSPGRVASHSKDPLWFPNTCCLMASPAGHLQSQWWRSCSWGRHFGYWILRWIKPMKLLMERRMVGAECEIWVPDGICKCMVTGEIDGMREWCLNEYVGVIMGGLCQTLTKSTVLR